MTQKILQTKDFSFGMKAEPKGVIEAYASVFGNIDKHGDVINPGAFSKTIQERSGKVKVLFNHDMWSPPVGTPKDISEDSKGLFTATQMSKTAMGQDIYTLVQEKAIDTMSIGYYAIKAFYPDEDDPDHNSKIYRYLNEVKLIEYSFVNLGSNELALVTGVKSTEDLDRQIKQWASIYEVGLKSGRPLGKDKARAVLEALDELKGVISSADHVTEEKDAEEPENHSLLDIFQDEVKKYQPPTQEDDGEVDFLAEFKAFGERLGSEHSERRRQNKTAESD